MRIGYGRLIGGPASAPLTVAHFSWLTTTLAFAFWLPRITWHLQLVQRRWLGQNAQRCRGNRRANALMPNPAAFRL
jgi:hypothetical protein